MQEPDETFELMGWSERVQEESRQFNGIPRSVINLKMGDASCM